MTQPSHVDLATEEQRRAGRFERALLHRLYLFVMRGESMYWLHVRRWIINRLLGRKHVGLNVFAQVFINGFEHLSIGDDVSINRWCHITANGGLTIGNHVSIAHSTSILTVEHSSSDLGSPIKDQPVRFDPVTIADNVWIGARVCVLAGTKLGPGTIVAAGAVVKHSVTEPNCTIGGVPARILKERR